MYFWCHYLNHVIEGNEQKKGSSTLARRLKT